MNGNGLRDGIVRYAVVGLGYIAQAAVLPAFARARANSRLTALISGDDLKLRRLGKKYNVKHLFRYDEYDAALEGGAFDAVYIALPNSMHADYTIRAANARIHVLCEKPMASTVKECQRMIAAVRNSDVRLMIAYRLHFEPANLAAIEIVKSGRLGKVRFFDSVFSLNIKNENVRLDRSLGGGPLQDIGIYCINAARYVFRAEPTEVSAMAVRRTDPRFEEVPEMVCGWLRFPEDRLASFTCSFNAADVASYRVIGTKGDLLVEPAYEWASGLRHRLTVDGKSHETRFKKVDQFAAELLHFSDCVLSGKDSSPTGEEGLADVRIIEAMEESARKHRSVTLDSQQPPKRPTLAQKTSRPPGRKPELVHAAGPTKGD